MSRGDMFLQNICPYLKSQKEYMGNRKTLKWDCLLYWRAVFFDLKIWSATETRSPYSTAVNVRRDYTGYWLGSKDKQSAREEINYLWTSLYVAVAEFDWLAALVDAALLHSWPTATHLLVSAFR